MSLVTDYLGECVPEIALDDPATWQMKGIKLPHTCFEEPTFDQTMWETHFGRKLSDQETAWIFHRTCQETNLNCGFTSQSYTVSQTEIPIPPIPLPATGLLLMLAVSAIITFQRRPA